MQVISRMHQVFRPHLWLRDLVEPLTGRGQWNVAVQNFAAMDQ